MKRLLFVVLVLVTAAAAKAESPKSVTLKPNKIIEKCMSLVPPQKIEYHFEASAKLNFNLHYHKGEQIYYPVKLDRTNGESGLYEVKAKEDYCLMWENRSGTDIDLTYGVRVAK
jgi:hypothetical protein